MLIVIAPDPPGASVTLPVGAVTSTTATSTLLAHAADDASSATDAPSTSALVIRFPNIPYPYRFMSGLAPTD
jgi:hypothetical protein